MSPAAVLGAVALLGDQALRGHRATLIAVRAPRTRGITPWDQARHRTLA